MIEDIVLHCNDPFDLGCHWSGFDDELVATDDDPDGFCHCPNCEGTNFTEEDED